MNVYIFGTGNLYCRFKHCFTDMNIVGFLDNDSSKWGSIIDGHKVYSPKELYCMEFDYIFLVSSFYEEMRNQLLELGIKDEVIIDKDHRGIFSNFMQTDQYLIHKECKIQKKKAIMFSHGLDLTGAPVVFSRLAQILNNSGFAVTMVAEKNSNVNHGELLYQLIQEGISVIMVSHFDYTDVESMAQNSDLIWVNTILLGKIVERLKSTNKNIYWWLHEADNIYMNQERDIFFPEYKNLYVVTVGWMAAKSFEKYSGNKVFRNLMYGIPDIYVDKEKKYAGGKIKFALIGAYSERKGQEILLETILKNKDKWKNNAEFYLVGHIPKNIMGKYASLENVLFMGEMNPSKLEKFYEEIDVLIAPSLFDPMPVVVSEAMQHKKTCIVSDNVGQYKYMTPYINGLIFHSGDINALTEKIDWIMNHKEKINLIGDNSYQIYKENFSMNTFKSNVTDLLTIIEF